MPAKNLPRIVCFALFAILLTGCASNPNDIDPWEKSNRAMYQFNENLDHFALKPIADGYRKFVPEPVRMGLGNMFDNLAYFNVIMNDFLQGQWNQGWSDSGRMLANSTLGMAGIFDVATSMHMPSHDNDFGITLGKWGVPQGPYMVLPLLGPTTVRDTSALPVQIVTNPTTWIDAPVVAFVSISAAIAIDQRARYEAWFRFRDEAALDPYVFVRTAYMQYRQNLIGEGKPQDQSIYDDDTMPPTSQPASAPAGPAQSAPSSGEHGKSK